MIKYWLFLLIATHIGLTSAGDEYKRQIESKVVSEEAGHVTEYDGSEFITYFIGQTSGTKNSITGIATIEPNNEIHPAHRHAEEEYLLVIEGNGIWELDGKKFPAKAGDMLYAKPWIDHGLFNSGDTPMKFVVWKWSSKGIKIPEDPASVTSEPSPTNK